MNKPKHCPLVEWELEEDSEDKRTVQPENSKCFLPAVFVKHGLPDQLGTPCFFRCPECYTDGGDYMNCDLFSRWWWYHFGGTKRIKKSKQPLIKPKKKIVPDIPISDGRIPLTNSGVKDRKDTVTNWAKFKMKG